MSKSKEELALEVDLTQWEWLRPHLERGALILVDPLLELAEVGVRVAADDLAQVQAWLASGVVLKPRLEQIEQWNQEPSRSFAMLVISPYVLIQPVV